MEKHTDTEFQKLVRERYSLSENPSYEEQGNFLCLLNAPEQYENEDEMLKYAKENPNITAKELCAYWDKITPDGLPPCAVDWEDDDDDD
ncbi:MAG: hypothetical protein RR827_01425 [Oscillospiraceae bacterium]